MEIIDHGDEKVEKWQYDLEEYIKQGEPDKKEKCSAWKTAIGLQDVDGLKTSDYLLETAKEHIDGNIDIAAAKKRIQSYYEQRDVRNTKESETQEADIVSVRIAELLSEKAFRFSPAELQNIHSRLFSGIIKNAGMFRSYNISKKEWVLDGESVIYASFESIKETLDYDFSSEKDFSYEGLSVSEAIKHISKFISGIWQIHPFCEGNTRTTAVFVIKYLLTFGFDISNDTFAENSWYFRNALVRANYNNIKKSIHETTSFLELFFENLILGKNNQLKNRYTHIDFQSATETVSKGQNGTLDGTLEETAIINLIKNDPYITQIKIAELTGMSERTIKRRISEMKNKNLLTRENGKRNGKWIILHE